MCCVYPMDNSLQLAFNSIQTCKPSEFSTHLQNALHTLSSSQDVVPIIQTLLVCNRNIFPGRINRFILQLFENLHQTNPTLLRQIFDYLVCFTSARSAKVRKHTLQIINMILSIAPYDLESGVIQLFAERLFDKETSVRKEALKISLMYQNYDISAGLNVQTTLKDLLKFDPVGEIRRIALAGLELNKNTQNTVIERVIDNSVNVRKTFWLNVFPKINFKDIPHCQRVFLLRSSFTEREFDSKTLFISCVQRMRIEDVADLFYCSLPMFDLLLKECLKFSWPSISLTNLTPGRAHLINLYLEMVELKDGRDELKLSPLNELLDLTVEMCQVEDPNKDSINTVIELLRMLKFYDIFTAESQKLIYRIVKKLIMEGHLSGVIEECVILINRVCYDQVVPLIGSFIKRLKDVNNDELDNKCISLCEAVMKHVAYSEMHDAILNEIAMPNLLISSDILFWSIIQRPRLEIISLYIGLLPDKKVIEGVSDLVLKKLIVVDQIIDQFRHFAESMTDSAAIPIAKLLVARSFLPEDEPFFFKYLLLVYYSTELLEIQQFLVVFFASYISINYKPVISVYCSVLESITANHKVFIDQTLYWLSRVDKTSVQQLYYTICLFIIRNYESLSNKKYLFATLEKIEPLPDWEQSLTKRILAIMALIIRRRPKENAQLLLSRLISIDDGVPMAQDEYQKLQEEIAADGL